MPQKILAEDWTAYDTRKRIEGDVTELDCAASWEVDYLAEKIITAYPLYKLQTVKTAIAMCCRNLPSPHKRTPFVTCLMRLLKDGVWSPNGD